MTTAWITQINPHHTVQPVTISMYGTSIVGSAVITLHEFNARQIKKMGKGKLYFLAVIYGVVIS